MGLSLKKMWKQNPKLAVKVAEQGWRQGAMTKEDVFRASPELAEAIGLVLEEVEETVAEPVVVVEAPKQGAAEEETVAEEAGQEEEFELSFGWLWRNRKRIKMSRWLLVWSIVLIALAMYSVFFLEGVIE